MLAEQTLPGVPSVAPRIAMLAIAAAALGYFVDVFDIVLFNVVRVPSLTALGIPQAQQLTTGVMLFDFQMGGMLLGGIAFGIWGDRRGRRSVLFASILLYSLGNLANAWVETVPAYAAARFVAGLGLAGELGAGVTLVCELLPKEKRGYGTALVAAVGILGGVAAPLVGEHLPWRMAYVVGGVGGLFLLALRATVPESAMYRSTERGTSRRGDLFLLFATRERAMRFLRALLVGLPLWYAIGILAAFAPEVGHALGINPGPTAGRAIFYAYIGLTFGDLASGLLSQWFRTRKWVMVGFLGADVLAVGLLLSARSTTAAHYYALCGLLGVANGYWALFITNAAEQFGTNLRATVATAVPNLIRGSTILITLLFVGLKGSTGVVGSAAIVGSLCLVIAMLSALGSRETFGKDLDYVEV
jgi:putative MFS transporter